MGKHSREGGRGIAKYCSKRVRNAGPGLVSARARFKTFGAITPGPTTVAGRPDGRGRDAHTPRCPVARSAVVSTAGTRASSPECCRAAVEIRQPLSRCVVSWSRATYSCLPRSIIITARKQLRHQSPEWGSGLKCEVTEDDQSYWPGYLPSLHTSDLTPIPTSRNSQTMRSPLKEATRIIAPSRPPR